MLIELEEIQSPTKHTYKMKILSFIWSKQWSLILLMGEISSRWTNCPEQQFDLTCWRGANTCIPFNGLGCEIWDSSRRFFQYLFRPNVQLLLLLLSLFIVHCLSHPPGTMSCANRVVCYLTHQIGMTMSSSSLLVLVAAFYNHMVCTKKVLTTTMKTQIRRQAIIAQVDFYSSILHFR